MTHRAEETSHRVAVSSPAHGAHCLTNGGAHRPGSFTAAEVLARIEAALDARDEHGVVPVVQAGDPVLRSQARSFVAEEYPAETIVQLIEAMRTTMRHAPGVGLAAPQVGIPVALAVIEDPGLGPEESPAMRDRERTRLPFRVIVNPSYIPVGDRRVSFYEGCLSVAGWTAVRSRWHSVRLVACDDLGNRIDETLTGWPARIVQHEADHLHGDLYLDECELRSLSSTENLTRMWAGEARPTAAAASLGFQLDD